MSSLNGLKNVSRKSKRRSRVGRGPGSGVGKTCGRGHKGSGARSGYKRRYGNEGGQLPLYMKLPTRGFSRARFQQKLDSINLYQLDVLYEDGEVVNADTLYAHGYLNGKTYGFKVLSEGELTKKVTIEAAAISAKAREKLEKAGITFSVEEE